MAYDSETYMDTEKLELTDKELEELANIRLKTGLSDSVVDLVEEEKKVERKKKSWIGPPVPKDRDAMGRYIPPEGKTPLTVYDRPGPGPGHYSPDDKPAATAAPAYTLGEVYSLGEKHVGPGPGKYNTGKNITWGRCKRITIKQHTKAKAVSPSPGPAAYNPPPPAVGPKFSIMGRHGTKQLTCFVSKLAKQLDPSVPGPDYNVPDTEWANKPVTFGVKQKTVKKNTGPGPNKYVPSKKETGPKWHFGRVDRKKLTKKDTGPGPGRYTVPSTLGGGPRAVLMPRRDPGHKWSDTPGPDVYNRAGFDLSEPGYTMKYRWFDPSPTAPAPGPATYSPHPARLQGPAYSLKHVTTPTYPSSVYAHLTVDAPGPNSYKPSDPKTTGKSFGTAAPPRVIRADEPGPADYVSSDKPLPRAPAFSIAGRGNRRPLRAVTPGPGSYSPRDVVKNKSAKSFGVKPKYIEEAPGPGPAAYRPCGGEPCVKCESAAGATLKSRHTPLQYSGLRDSAVVRAAPLPDLPFFGIDPGCTAA